MDPEDDGYSVSSSEMVKDELDPKHRYRKLKKWVPDPVLDPICHGGWVSLVLLEKGCGREGADLSVLV